MVVGVLKTVGSVMTLAALTLVTASSAKAVIYGNDDRVDLSDSRLEGTTTATLARSTAVLINRQQVRQALDFATSFDYVVDGSRLGERFALCEPDPFQDQFAPGFCSGFLATPNTLVTAGHCLAAASACQNLALVFGFTGNSLLNDKRRASSDDVYFCKDVVAQRIDPSSGVDYAIIRLDRPVKNREPLPLRQGLDLPVGSPVSAIAYPHGAPAKYIGGAAVRNADNNKPFFVANIDGFTGNSGAPVFGANQQVEGIIVRGDSSYQQTESCLKPIHCDNGDCRGEDVLKTRTFIDKIPFETPSVHITGIRIDDIGHGNGNGYPEPGETLRLLITIKNAGKTAASHLQINLQARDNAAQIVYRPTITLPDLGPDASYTLSNIWLEIPPSANCRQALTLDLIATFNGGKWASSYELPLGREVLREYKVSAEKQLDDYLPNGQAFAIPVDQAPEGRRVLFGVNIAHDKPKQLIITVKAPDGTSGVLYKNGLPRVQYPTPTSPETVNGLYGSNLEPFNDIGHFRDVHTAGNWQMIVTDVARGDAALVHDVSVVIADRQCQAP